jgi:uncharacterized protein YjiS (DUF1127 family)
MKNEAHVIGDRVPNERDLILELKLAPLNAGDEGSARVPIPHSPTRFSLTRRFFGFVMRTFRERHNRLALLELNDDQLKDIGVSRCEVYYGGYSRYRRSQAATGSEVPGDGSGTGAD